MNEPSNFNLDTGELPDRDVRTSADPVSRECTGKDCILTLLLRIPAAVVIRSCCRCLASSCTVCDHLDNLCLPDWYAISSKRCVVGSR